MHPSNLWTMMQVMAQNMRPPGVGGGGGAREFLPVSGQRCPTDFQTKPRPLPPDFSVAPPRNSISSMTPLSIASSRSSVGQSVQQPTDHTLSHKSSPLNANKTKAQIKKCDETQNSTITPADATSKGAFYLQRQKDQEWVDNFLRNRGYKNTCLNTESKAEINEETEVIVENRNSLNVVSSSEKEKTKRREKEWRRRRREDRKRLVETNSADESATDSVTVSASEAIKASESTDYDLSQSKLHESALSPEISSRNKRRREIAELDDMEAKIDALEKLRKLRRRGAAKNPAGHEVRGDNDKKMLDDLVADSVFDSNIEKLGQWIELRREAFGAQL